jgi:rubrerythrin
MTRATRFLALETRGAVRRPGTSGAQSRSVCMSGGRMLRASPDRSPDTTREEIRMVTTTGAIEGDITSLVKDLILLEHDAIAAYDSTIEKLSDPSFKSQIASFREDHLQHLEVLQEMARETGAEAPAEGDMKQMLTTGKIALANLMGDGAILKAMKTNEDDTVAAYERAARHGDAIAKSRAFFEKAHADEVRHREWMQRTAESL